MSAVWDGDTGTVTITATKNGAAVNLSGSSSRALIVRNRSTGTATTLTISSSDLPNGIVTASVQSLGVGEYDTILRVVTGSETATYPSADVGPSRLTVRADVDAS